MEKNKTVDEYIKKRKDWFTELIFLRKIILSTELQETIKWGAPVYTINGKNVVGIAAFKSYVSLWFFQGALLKDKKKKLVNAQEGVTKALRHWKFNSKKEIDKKLVKEYLLEAIENQKKGKQIKPAAKKPLKIPKELNSAFTKNKKLKNCFGELTPYKQREYAEYISEAKREETKMTRLKKIIPMILEKKGLNDKYKNC